MKIRKDQQTQLEIDRNRQQESRKNIEAKHVGAALKEDGGDTVQLSVSREIAGAATARSERIAELKELIASDKYKPDAKGIAQKLDSILEEEITFEKIYNR